MVKLTALLALVGIVPFAFTRYGPRDAARAAIAGFAVLVAGLALVPSSLSVLLGSDHRVSRASAWNVVARFLLRPSVRDHGGLGLDLVLVAASAAVIVLACTLALARRRDRTPFGPVSVAAGSYAAAGAYVLPGYALWSLPTYAATGPTVYASIAALAAGVVTAAYQLPQSNPHSAWDPVARGLTTMAAPLPLLAAFVVAAVVHGRLRPHRRPDPALAGAA
jgi:hypothetical protein